MRIKQLLIIVGLTVTLGGLLGVFGYGPLAAAVTGSPLANTPVNIVADTTCPTVVNNAVICSNNPSIGIYVSPTISPTTQNSITDATGNVKFVFPTFSSATNAYPNCNPAIGGYSSGTFPPAYHILVNGVDTGALYFPVVAAYSAGGSCSGIVIRPSTAVPFQVQAGSGYVTVNFCAALSCSTTTTTSTSTSTSTSTTSTTTTTTTTATTTTTTTTSTSNFCLTNCPPGTFPILGSIAAIAGVGITVVGIKRKDD